MNLVLFEPAELGLADEPKDGDRFAPVTAYDLEVEDRRAAHLATVLRVQPGARVRVGVLGGGLGFAEVLTVGDHRLALRVTIDRPPVPRLPVHLILAVPRPKVLARAVAIAASFGVERIDLTNSWRVDKSYLGSPALEPPALERAARDGAEQGVTSRLPALRVHRRFMAMIDELAAAPPIASRVAVVAHPASARPLEAAVEPGERRPVTLAIGPEGGFIEREVETFERLGFARASLGAAVLRVEAAVAALLGQVELLRRLTRR